MQIEILEIDKSSNPPRIIPQVFNWYFEQDLRLDDKVPALVPTHNSLELLEHFSQFGRDVIHPVIIDDRSSEDVKGFCEHKNWSYIRCDNDFGFNYSILMNYGAMVLKESGVQTALFLNNDCYIHDSGFFNQFLDRHKKSGGPISGIKLVYPPKHLAFNKQDTAPAVEAFFKFKAKESDHREKVQFGGGIIDRSGNAFHRGRFFDITDPEVDRDDQVGFLTGACNLVNLEEFIQCGGYSVNLATAYQDVELASRLGPQNYFGKDIFFYHDESLSRLNFNAFSHDYIDRSIYKELTK